MPGARAVPRSAAEDRPPCRPPARRESSAAPSAGCHGRLHPGAAGAGGQEDRHLAVHGPPPSGRRHGPRLVDVPRETRLTKQRARSGMSAERAVVVPRPPHTLGVGRPPEPLVEVPGHGHRGGALKSSTVVGRALGARKHGWPNDEGEPPSRAPRTRCTAARVAVEVGDVHEGELAGDPVEALASATVASVWASSWGVGRNRQAVGSAPGGRSSFQHGFSQAVDAGDVRSARERPAHASPGPGRSRCPGRGGRQASGTRPSGPSTAVSCGPLPACDELVVPRRDVGPGGLVGGHPPPVWRVGSPAGAGFPRGFGEVGRSATIEHMFAVDERTSPAPPAGAGHPGRARRCAGWCCRSAVGRRR